MPEACVKKECRFRPAVRQPGTRSEEAREIEEATVEVAFDGGTLAGVISRPVEEREKKAVVFVHGWGTGKTGPARLIVEMGRRAALAGWRAMRFDLPGRGESPGEYGETDIDGMIDATLAGVEFMKEEGAEEVYLSGLCSGANVALGAAGLWPEKISGVLALSALPYQEHRGARMRMMRSMGKAGGYLKKAVKLSTWKRLIKGEISVKGVAKTVSASDATSGVRNLKKSSRDLPGALKEYSGIVAMVWGEKDAEAEASREYFTSLLAGKVSSADIYTVETAGHNYYGLEPRNDVCGILESFLGTGGRGGML